MHDQKNNIEEIILGAGCFWGVEYYLKKLPGIISLQVGYSGGHKDNPTYQEVCAKDTGHIEVIRVLFNSHILSCESLLKYFFEIHDFSQTNGQGPDIGPQYLSKIFYLTQIQYHTALQIIQLLEQQGNTVATQLLPATTFFIAEEYHQNYYSKVQQEPYCHVYIKKF